MKLVMQPTDFSLCGQACVATIAGVSLEESIKAFGTRGGTHSRHVIKACKQLGISCGDKLIRLRKGTKKPDLCMVMFHFGDRINTHWVVFVRTKNIYGENIEAYLDPSHGLHFGYPKSEIDIRETSFLPIFEKATNITYNYIAPWECLR